MGAIGFSTGSLYKSNMDLNERIKLYNSLGASAIELGFSTPNELFEYDLNKDAIKDLKKYDFVSIHAPWKKIVYGANTNTNEVLKKLEKICQKTNIDGIVLHPDTIDDFKLLEKSNLPFLLENMDQRKDFGTYIEDFKFLNCTNNLGYVLDLQHAYEHDPSMDMAYKLLEVMGDRLSHLHVSGQLGNEMHVPIHMAGNRSEITSILTLGVNVPKIFEGVLEGDIKDTIKKEISYVKRHEPN
jgi:hypothetical protein